MKSDLQPGLTPSMIIDQAECACGITHYRISKNEGSVHHIGCGTTIDWFDREPTELVTNDSQPTTQTTFPGVPE